MAQVNWRANDNQEPCLDSGAEIVGYFSTNRVKTYLPDSSRLTYYKPPRNENVYFDLNRGIEWAIPRNYSGSADGRLLFKWIEANHETIKAPPETDRWLEPNFVCSIGTLSMLLCDNSSRDSWAIRAAKWRGTIYLAITRKKTHVSFQGGLFPQSQQQMYTSWLHKFERYVTSDHANDAPNPCQVVVEPDEFKCVYKARFGEHTILYDAPSKAVRSETQLSDPLPHENLKFVLLRLSKHFNPGTENYSIAPKKFQKCWSMGYLTNTAEVLWGFRNDEGIVQKVKTYSLQEMVNKEKFNFKPASCVADLKSFLTKVATTVVVDETIYQFEKVPHQPEFEITQLSPKEYYTVIPPDFVE